MILTVEKTEEFDRVMQPVMEWLHKNCHPHTTIIVDSMNAELVEGMATTSSKIYPEQGEPKGIKKVKLDSQTIIRLAYSEYDANDGVAPDSILDSGVIKKSDEVEPIYYVILHSQEQRSKNE